MDCLLSRLCCEKCTSSNGNSDSQILAHQLTWNRNEILTSILLVIWKFKAITSVNPDPYYEVQQYILFFFQQVFKLSSRNQSTAIWWSMLVVYLLFFDKPEMETVTLKYWRSIYHEKWNINQYSIGTNWKGWLAIAKLKPLSLWSVLFFKMQYQIYTFCFIQPILYFIFYIFASHHRDCNIKVCLCMRRNYATFRKLQRQECSRES